MSSVTKWIVVALVSIVVAGVVVALWAVVSAGQVDPDVYEQIGWGADDGVSGGEDADGASGAAWPIFVNRPDGPPRVETGRVDELGRPVTVSCASCHANLEPDRQRRSADSPAMSFHQGMHYDHGGLSCISCHNPENYNTLRLADGSAVDYPDVITMCSQCHSSEARDWEAGAHGGMTGYWDRRRGAQVRKSCIDCHDPHSPAYPRMRPTFKPYDRFLTPEPRAAEGGDG